MHYDLRTGLYRFILFFYFAILTMTVFTTMRNSMRERIWNPFSGNSELGKSEIKGENCDLCKTKNVIKGKAN